MTFYEGETDLNKVPVMFVYEINIFVINNVIQIRYFSI